MTGDFLLWLIQIPVVIAITVVLPSISDRCVTPHFRPLGGVLPPRLSPSGPLTHPIRRKQPVHPRSASGMARRHFSFSRLHRGRSLTKTPASGLKHRLALGRPPIDVHFAQSQPSWLRGYRPIGFEYELPRFADPCALRRLFWDWS